MVKDIYQLRNDFVHSAVITPLNEEEEPDAEFSSSSVMGVIGSKYKPIMIKITIKEFESIFEQAIKKVVLISLLEKCKLFCPHSLLSLSCTRIIF